MDALLGGALLGGAFEKSSPYDPRKTFNDLENDIK